MQCECQVFSFLLESIETRDYCILRKVFIKYPEFCKNYFLYPLVFVIVWRVSYIKVYKRQFCLFEPPSVSLVVYN